MGIRRSSLEISGASLTLFGPEEYAITYPSEETELIVEKVAQARDEVATLLTESVIQGSSLAVQSDVEYYVNGVPQGKRVWISVDRSRYNPKCFEQYQFTRRSLYKTIFNTAVNTADFSDFVTFASASEDRYYAREMLSETVAGHQSAPAYVWTPQHTIDRAEQRRRNHNDRVKALQHALGSFAAKLYETDKQGTGSSIWSSFNKKQKTRVLLDDAFYKPLTAAADRPSIEHVFVANALRKN